MTNKSKEYPINHLKRRYKYKSVDAQRIKNIIKYLIRNNKQ